MEEKAIKTASAANNTATSAEQGQTLLNPQASDPAPGTESAAGAEAAASETGKEGEDAPLLSPEGKDPAEKPEAATGAPEAYEAFQLPEGFELQGELLEEATALFKGLNLNQENAQKLVDYYTKRVLDEKAAGLNELAARRKAWRAEVRQRPNYAAERALAMRGMRAVLTDPDEIELFKDSWMSDHPALWKMFTKIGRLVGEDTPPKGGASGASSEDDINLRRFPVGKR